MKPVKLAINGREQDEKTTIDNAHPMLELKKSILVSGSTRGDARRQEINLDKDSLVELVFDDDTTWLCPSDSLEDIYPGSLVQNRDGESFIELPTELEHPDASRGILGKIALKVLNLFTKKIAVNTITEIAKDLEEKQMGSLRGLVRVSDGFELEKLGEINTGSPILLFIHGTNSSTKGSFAELKGSRLWDHMVSTYGKNILAFQHETLTKSPLQNAVDLVEQLPANANLDVITHSRGGLVGEILCRFSGASGAEMGFTEQEIAVLDTERKTKDDSKAITQLREKYPAKKFIVKKFIRVACPSSGTTLVSKRLDYFFNISLNLLGTIPVLAASPVYAAMKNLLIAIVDQKNDPEVLPGLEAMKPDSPFITVLNNQALNSPSIAASVVAISGNCKMKVNLKALVIIASKLFFFEDNDLVVNTKSMYNGSRRKDKLQFFFDEGTDVDHFHYFKNSKTNEAILIALKSTTALIDGFTESFRGTVGVAERNAALGIEGGQYSTGEPSGKKPIVILLPGIMGSALSNDNGLVWINYLKFLTGGLINLSLTGDIKEPGAIIKTSYRSLGETLSAEYDVVTFAFDWRRSLDKGAEKFNDKILKLMKLNQPIKIIGHSMGGVLVRDFMVFYPDTWKELNASKDFRLLFLGSPLNGSFRINNVLFGEDDIISKLSKIDIIHTKKKLLTMFATFPGLLCLLPFNKDPENDFAKLKVWEDMKDAFNGDDDWPLPAANDLKNFGMYRDKVLASKSTDFSNAVYIAGQYKETPSGYRIDDTARGKELVFLSTAEGDQSVTWESGIPKEMITNNKVYYANCSHGALSNTASIFSAIKEILQKGETLLITKTRPVVRGDQKEFKRIQTSDFDFSSEGLENTILGLSSEDKVQASELPLKVTVAHGDLKYAAYPILAGHFKNDSILYAEARIDGLLGGALSQLHKLALYPGAAGTHEIQLTYADRFQGAIIIGLDQPGNLTAFELLRSAEQGMIKYLVKVNGREGMNSTFHFKEPLGISSLIIGCGYGGLSVENAAEAILQGIANANAKMKILYNEKAKLIEFVEFVELYEDRALNAIIAIRRLSKEAGGPMNITLENHLLKTLNGAKQQMNTGQSTEWWNRITITQKRNDKGDAVEGMNFSISSGAAKEDQRIIFTGSGLVEELIEGISTDNNWTVEKARAIFELMVPNAFKNSLQRHSNVVWVLDDYTAGYPWELLQDKSKDAKPLCINAGMIRQLKTANSTPGIETISDNAALVIGDPELNGFFPQLPGARKEGKMVKDLLDTNGFNTRDMIGASAINIIPALMSYDYKIVHIAAHGAFNPDEPQSSGVVIGKNSFLNSAQIAQISSAQELVFVNCCYLGKSSGVKEELYQSRYKLAANIGTQLINNGVKAVIVAGWAVDDAAAFTFAQRFYEGMFQGKTFGEAIRTAREEIYDSFGKKNTWGAYQCYGDPFYKLHDNRWNKTDKNYVITKQAVIDLNNLLSDIKTGEGTNEDAENKLKAISDEVDKKGIRTPEITEQEAMIEKELNNYEKAIAKFTDLLTSPEAKYSFIAAEQYCNIRIKHLIKVIDKTGIEAITENDKATFKNAMKDLEALILLNPSVERYTLMGSAWKRRIYFYKNNKSESVNVIKQASNNYKSAYLRSQKKDPYSYINFITLINALVLAGELDWGTKPLSSDKAKDDIGLTIKEINSTLEAIENENSGKGLSDDYWGNIIIPNVELCKWMMQATRGVPQTPKPKLKPRQIPSSNAVFESYNKVWKMTGSKDQKQIEVENLDFFITAISILAPQNEILPELKMLRQRLDEAIGGS